MKEGSPIGRWLGLLGTFTGAILFCLACAASAADAPLADFGDAPDGVEAGYAPPHQAVIGQFPTSFATTNRRYGLPGLHILDSSQEHLGVRQSLEIDASDPGDPDLVENFVDDDFDDGLTGGACPTVSPVGAWPDAVPVTLDVDVNAGSGGPLYLNILLDIDHDGTWANTADGLPEWVVVDHAVALTPGGTATITTPSFLVPLAFSPAWARITLTESPVTGTFADDGRGWDGGGAFLRGEVEDHKIGHQLGYASAAAAAEA